MEAIVTEASNINSKQRNPQTKSDLELGCERERERER